MSGVGIAARKRRSPISAPFLRELDPIELRVSHDELVVVSFPGPDRSIRMEDLKVGRAVSRRYRNRRIGEFFKELEMTEGRSTGIPKILKETAANGSSAPVFETDDDRLSFVIRLPRHPCPSSRPLAGGKSQGKLSVCCAP